MSQKCAASNKAPLKSNLCSGFRTRKNILRNETTKIERKKKSFPKNKLETAFPLPSRRHANTSSSRVEVYTRELWRGRRHFPQALSSFPLESSRLKAQLDVKKPRELRPGQDVADRRCLPFFFVLHTPVSKYSTLRNVLDEGDNYALNFLSERKVCLLCFTPVYLF